MKKLYFLNDEEKNRILNLHEGATKSQYLNEAETNIQKIARNLYTAANGPGTDTTLTSGIPAWISQIKDIPTYNAVNLILKQQDGGYPDIPSMINGESIDVPGMKSIITHLKKIGIQSKADISSSGDWVNKGGFKIIKITPPSSNPKQDVDGKKKVQQPVVKQPAVVDPKVAYQKRVQQITQQTQNTTKEVQKLLGQQSTGNLDSLYIEKLISLLQSQ